ncbi:aromatic acid transporter [Streptomyces sviceus ATCC 29083]|uniref:Aromatic acid transporter n=1 Tax=Streptomyces sviceus (strain ATCC 29083 / DSM 924 / JCM 4929 / NBRC 13980 / NCIMB 11184 / NRRL 5439 / UC 5370) TaxID=463191 RepID=B5HWH3_STRX2|nr:aromatic acid transporter [Streptomyces sviceus ATCC 29083]
MACRVLGLRPPTALRPGAGEAAAGVAELPGSQGPRRGGHGPCRALRRRGARREYRRRRGPLDQPGEPLPRERVDPDAALLGGLVRRSAPRLRRRHLAAHPDAGRGLRTGLRPVLRGRFNLGGIVGMLVAGRAPDRFGAPRISALWFTLTAAGVFLLSVQTMIYATVSIRSDADNRATAVGWTSGMGRFGAVFGPWLGGQLLASGNGDWGFTAFAVAGLSSMVFIGMAPAPENDLSDAAPRC